MSKHQKLVRLNNNTSIPAIAFGTGTAWYVGDNNKPVNRALVDSINDAFKLGYTHIDCAEMYGTEREAGISIKESGIPREQLYITTKIFKNMPDPAKALQDSLDRMQLDYVDLYLIHAPFVEEMKIPTDIKTTWQGLEKLVEQGKTKSIGVSNFRVQDLKDLLSYAKIKPVVNQIELHPYVRSRDIVEFCKKNGIVLEAYTPLASLVHTQGGPVDAVVDQIAARLGRTAAQVLLRWNLQYGDVVVTTSRQPDRLKEFLAIDEFELSNDDVHNILDAGAKHDFRKYWHEHKW